MNKISYIIAILLLTTSLLSLSAQHKKDVVGKWNYKVTDAPYGFDKGVLEIEIKKTNKEKKDSLTAKVTFYSGQQVALQHFTVQNDTLWANLTVDGEYIMLKAKVDKQIMTGIVNTSMGKMSLMANKVVEE